ncbi:calcium-binding protein [Azospirillum doebereinerae]|uniref:Calcium-binding protein n=1 Tax=Azospirillum doebereinerae TaxID=92933 RepID=A0A433J1A3_9PROT|nr:calcium-binding protein [Azospirillum doebereinerae]RUQ63973.1 calcium-binding protein [Azospirillum doebereinerae]
MPLKSLLVSNEARVNTYTTDVQANAAVTVLASGQSVVTWTSIGQDGSLHGVYAQQYDAGGNAVGGEFRVNTYTNNAQTTSRIAALNDGGYVIVWHSIGQDGSGYGVYGQRFDAGGLRVGGEFHISTGMLTYDQGAPKVAALADGGFIVAWEQSEPDNVGSDIYAQRFNASGAAVGGNVMIDGGDANGLQTVPAVAGLPNGGYVVVWGTNVAPGTEGTDIAGRVYDASGTPVGPAFQVNSFLAPGSAVANDSDPNVAALEGGGFVVTWNSTNHDGSGSGVYGQRFDAAGTPIGSEFQLSTYTTGDQTDAWVSALAGGGFVAAWTSSGQDGSGKGVYAQRFSQDGVKVGGEFRLSDVTAGDQVRPRVAARPDGGFVVAYESPDANSSGVYYRTFSASTLAPIVSANEVETSVNTTLNASVLVSQGHAQGPQYAQGGLQQVSYYEFVDLDDRTDSGYFTINGVGQQAGKVIHVSAEQIGSLRYISGATPNQNDFLVRVFDGIHLSNWSEGTVVGYAPSETLTATAQSRVNTYTTDVQANAAVTVLASGQSVVTWTSIGQDGSLHGVYAQQYDAGGNAVGGEFRVNTYTNNAQTTSRIAALNDGGYVIVWHSIGQDGSGYGVYGQRFDAGGLRVGGEFHISTGMLTYDQGAPKVAALADGGFIVAWEQSEPDNVGSDIYAQRFNASGAAVGGNVMIDGGDANGLQTVPAVAGLPNGGYVVVWGTNVAPGTEGTDIAGRVYDASGTPVGPAFQVNSFLAPGSAVANDSDPNVAALEGGGFVVTWNSTNHDGSGSGVYGQRFDAAGTPIGSEFQLSTYTTGDQTDAWVSALAGGGFVAAWTSSGQDGSGKGVYAQRFSQDGVKVGGEFRLSDVTAGDQVRPRVAARPDGGFVVAYESPDASSSGVYRRVFSATTPDPVPYAVVHAPAGGGTASGSAMSDRIIGGPGADTLLGGASRDVLYGADGADVLDGQGGDDLLVGGAGNDIYIVSDTGDVVLELPNEGHDEVRTSLAIYGLGNDIEDLRYSGSGHFTGVGNTLNNLIVGGSGNDTLDGGFGSDTLVGGSGNDIYVVDNVGDVVTELAGEGVDEIRVTLAAYTLGTNLENLSYIGGGNFAGTGNGLDNMIVGGGGNDTLFGLEGADTLFGNAGQDWLDGGMGADSLLGGLGNDTYIIDDIGDVVVELAGQGSDTVRSAIDYTLGTNVEALVLTGGALTGTGNALNNNLIGTAAANTLIGLDGNDTLNGGAGADTLIGGTGNDTYVIDNVGDVLIELPGEGTDTVQSSISYTLLADFENLTLTGSAAIAGTGNAANNLLTGNGAANLLTGLEGDDTLNGGGGADTLIGGTGNDTYVVDNVGDMVTELAGEGIDTVNASIGWTLGANIDNLTLTGSVAISATGNELNNVLTGNGGANLLDGGLGADSMAGGAGNDVYIVDDAGDVVTELAGQGSDEVRTSLSSYLLGANVEALTSTGTGDFTGTGNALDNRLTGGLGNDTLSGGDGADTLDGGAGSNLLIGGAGNDVYLVGNLGDQVVELAGEGIDEVRTALTGYTLTEGVETLTYTGTAAFAGTGNALDNLIAGGTGTDTLDGGLGADTLIGGLGDDVYVVDSVGDTVIEGVDAGIDEVRTTLSAFTLGDNMERLVFQGGDASGIGNGLDNWLAGNVGNDTLDGGAGNDTLLGGLGNDVLTGGSGADLFAFASGDGLDTITDFDAAQGDRIGLAAGQAYSVDINASGDAVIVYGTSDIVTLVGIQPAAVSSAWFVTL